MSNAMVTPHAMLAGLPRLIRLRWRAHWPALIGWPVVIGGLVASTSHSITTLYDTPAARASYQVTAGASPVSIALNGRGCDLAELGGIVVYEVGFYGLLVLPAIALHLAIGLTRGEEEPGRDELVTAGRVGRLAPLAAGALLVTGCLMLSGVAIVAALTSAGLPWGGSVRYAVGQSLAMLGWGAFGLACAQLSRSGRGAQSLGLALLGVAYLARAVVDGRDLDLVWLNPTGWLPELRPFGEWRAWPLVAYAVLAGTVLALAVVLRTRRDLGFGLLPDRSGRGRAGRVIRTPSGLVARLIGGLGVGWSAAAFAWGVALGVLAPATRAMIDGNAALAAALGGAAGTTGDDLVAWLSGLMVAALAACAVVQALGRLALDESAARLGWLVATRTSRSRWLLIWGVMAAGVGAMVLIVGGAGTDLGLALALNEHPGTVGIMAALSYLPAVLVVVATTTLAWSAHPRLALSGWVLVAWVSVVGIVGDTLDLPGWLRGTSPFAQVGRVPIEDPEPLVLATLVLIAVGAFAVAMVRFRSRDLVAG